MLSTYLALSRTGHLKQVYHIFGYLKENPKKTLVFDPRHPKIDKGQFNKTADWHEFYRYAEEAITERNSLKEEKLCQRIALLMLIMLGIS
jgi:hypothetical protein